VSKNHQINNSELLRDLSQQEQESLSSGQGLNFLGKSDFFIQQTNIQTESNNILKSGDDSNTQTTKYNFSQITIGASFTFAWPAINSSSERWNRLINNLLQNFSNPI
jgi:hypothetical protein